MMCLEVSSDVWLRITLFWDLTLLSASRGFEELLETLREQSSVIYQGNGMNHDAVTDSNNNNRRQYLTVVYWRQYSADLKHLSSHFILQTN